MSASPPDNELELIVRRLTPFSENANWSRHISLQRTPEVGPQAMSVEKTQQLKFRSAQ